MFPIRDHNPSGGTPYATWALIAVNVAVFLATWPFIPTERALAVFYDHWGLVPLHVLLGHDWHGVLTSMFLHAGWMHLGGNMLFLWVFGDNLEDRMGHLPFLGFYLLSGAAAAAFQIAADPYSQIPMVGASGAIAGVMGGYLLLFPRARVDVFFFFVVFFRIIPIPAWITLAFWFGLQIVNGLLTGTADGGVAHWAHSGGFIAGLVLTLPLWLRLGGPRFWRQTQGHPAHPAAAYRMGRSAIPRVRRMR